VEEDEKELGLRRILNFGHTIGHALEASSDFTLAHGEAVAIGMVAASLISHKLNHLDETTWERIRHLIDHFGLPTKIPSDMETSQILAYMASDKKAVAGQLHLVLLKQIGTPFVTRDVSLEVIAEAIEELRA
jgi:3-dehydroquinate synthase